MGVPVLRLGVRQASRVQRSQMKEMQLDASVPGKGDSPMALIGTDGTVQGFCKLNLNKTW